MKSVTIIGSPMPMDQNNTFAVLSRAGDFVWISGQVATDESGAVVGADDLIQQERYIFGKLRDILNHHVGCGLDSIVKLTTYFSLPLTNELASKYWEVRREFFGDRPPPSTGVQVVSLVLPELLLEIEAVAYAPEKKTHKVKLTKKGKKNA